MIGRLTGRIARKAPQQVILDVHGVGYRVLVSLTTFYALPDEGAEVSLETYTGVREDAILLYGFWETREKALFEKLITVSKIGPKLALNILSGISVADLKAAGSLATAADHFGQARDEGRSRRILREPRVGYVLRGACAARDKHGPKKAGRRKLETQ